MLPRRFLIPSDPTLAERAQRLGPFLLVGDDLADACVASMDDELPKGTANAMLERVLREGAAAVAGLPSGMRTFFEAVEHVPAWVDFPTLDRGGDVVMRTGPVGGLVLAFKSLLHGYASPGGNKPLVFSGRLQQQAARRLNETSRFVQATCEPGGLQRGAPGYAITVKVRLMHAKVRRMLRASERWDTPEWGTPINQHDMAATALLFSHVWLDGVRILGVHLSPRDNEDVMHMWRYSGHLMGIVPELQCSTEREGRRLFDLVEACQAPPDDDARALVHALLFSSEQARPGDADNRKPPPRWVAFAICRTLLGEELADSLAVPRTPGTLAVPVVRRLIRTWEAVRSRVPAVDSRAAVAGRVYWDRIVAMGLGGIEAEFALPSRLHGLPPRA